MKYRQTASLTSFLTIRPRDAVGDLFLPESVDDVVRFTVEHHSFYLLGGGSNIIAGKVGRPVLSLRLLDGESSTHREEDGKIVVSMPAWVRTAQLVEYLVANGLSGLEFMAGIPGTVGGAIAGNAAPKGCSWDGIVRSIAYVKEGSVLTTVPRFAYRQMAGVKPPFVILFAELVLRKSTVAQVKKQVSAYAKKRLRIPYPSAGSLFKNPDGVSAGELLEKAGCKGLSIGDAALYEEHANIVINRGDAAYGDFVALRDEAVKRVFRTCGVRLEPEVKFWD